MAVPAISSTTLLVMGDSLEVMSGFYLERIQELETCLKRLTLLENAREITALCHEIIRAKNALNALSIKTTYIA